ncbi:MAG: glycosyltransferase family 2 protein [Xanthomonadales bacterium]|nr:glycosyltransferase family 2 protein [Xanthomonadales bacterium]
MSNAIELTVLMPCLNEAESLAICIGKAQGYFERSGVVGEVLIADNGSTDGSQEIATGMGARVVHVEQKGYGSAIAGGIAAANGRYVIMGDADDSYDFSRLDPFVEKLREGYQLVMGNRFKGGIEAGAMPWLHKYLGNPVLSFIGKLFFGSPVSDFHCGLRGFDRAAIQALDLKTSGMEFASEMVVRASLFEYAIAEVPTTLSQDKRTRAPHLNTWRDGWRHLRFLLAFSSKWLFFMPGILLLVSGLLITATLAFGDVYIGGVGFGVHTMLFSSLAVVVGFQLIQFAYLSKLFAASAGLVPAKPWMARLGRSLSLERGLLISAVLMVLALVSAMAGFGLWADTSFGELDPARVMRLVIPSATLFSLGVQLFFGSFLMWFFQFDRSRVRPSSPKSH